jgi:hypothetical protein
MHAAILTITLLGSFIAPALAANDESLATYLRERGLTPAECLERAPRELMGWVAEREKLGYTGTTGHEQTVISSYYASYRAALRPEIDARYPNARKLRDPLQKLHCFIYDSMAEINGARAYITHDRIAAYTEHILAQLYSSPGKHPIAASSHLTGADVVTFARLKAALSDDLQKERRPDFDRYST